MDITVVIIIINIIIIIITVWTSLALVRCVQDAQSKAHCASCSRHVSSAEP